MSRETTGVGQAIDRDARDPPSSSELGITVESRPSDRFAALGRQVAHLPSVQSEGFGPSLKGMRDAPAARRFHDSCRGRQPCGSLSRAARKGFTQCLNVGKRVILNLTQHPTTAEQRTAGVVDLEPRDAAYIRHWLTADSLEHLSDWTGAGDPPLNDRGLELHASPATRAAYIADRAAELGATHAMIGGAPWLMAPLHAALMERGIKPLYAFSRRESVEEMQPDGSVRKINVFRHAGFVE